MLRRRIKSRKEGSVKKPLRKLRTNSTATKTARQRRKKAQAGIVINWIIGPPP